MDLELVIDKIIDPSLAFLPLSMDDEKAIVMLLTIGQQESRFEHRRQIGNGPARGFWQFERGGGVNGVMTHKATTAHAHRLCEEREVPWDSMAIWAALETDDLLACGFARLLLFSDPKRLPSVSDVDGAWNLYTRTWRPGKPHRETWNAYHRLSRQALGIPV